VNFVLKIVSVIVNLFLFKSNVLYKCSRGNQLYGTAEGFKVSKHLFEIMKDRLSGQHI